MSWEEDFLMKRIGDVVKVLKGADMLDECAACHTLFAVGIEKCPNCGHPAGEPKDAPVGIAEVESNPAPADDSEEFEDGEDENVNDYAEFNVEQLRDQAKDRGLFHPSNAKRGDLVALLQADDRKHQSEPLL